MLGMCPVALCRTAGDCKLSRAKDAYEKFQDAMGNWERTPFEHLSTREMEAWNGFGVLDGIGIDALEEARRKASEYKKGWNRVETENHALQCKLEALEEQNEALRGQINSFDDKFQAEKKSTPKAAKPKKKGGKR